MNWHLLLTVSVFASAATAAELTAVAPPDKAVVSQLRPTQAAFAAEPWSACRRYFDGGELAKSLKKDGCRPACIHLKWQGGVTPYAVVVRRFPDGKVFFSGTTTACALAVDSLEIAREWDWTVTDAAGASVTRCFRTADQAPRLVRVEGVPNIRDLGGRVGLNGRRIRQGLLFRSSGLNDNSTGSEKAGDQKPGAARLTEAERARLRTLYGFKTDIDLRRPDEIYGMTGSPLGPDVRWRNLRFATYAGFTNDVSRARAKAIFGELFDTNSYPVVFHCIAGADRTGTLAYLVNGLLGVPEDEALKDYLTTALIDHGVADTRHLENVDAMTAAMRTFPGETFAARTAAYVRSLGFTQKQIDGFRAFLLEDSSVPPAWEPYGIPYELVRAGRMQDDFKPVIPFESADGWRVESENAVASVGTTSAHRLFGKGALRLVYRATDAKKRPVVKLLPSAPVPLPADANAISIWCYGNNNYGKDAAGKLNTPSTTLFAEFADGSGGECECELEYVKHREWFLSFRRIPEPVLEKARKGGLRLTGFQLRGGKNLEDREILLTSFCAFKDDLSGMLDVHPRAKRGVQIFADAPQGVNTGEGTLPFPNSPRTILPPEKATDARLEFRLPKDPAASWDDLAFRWDGGAWIPLAQGGGVYPLAARKGSKVVFRRDGDSLIADVVVKGGLAEEVRFGSVGAPSDAALVPVPYLSFHKPVTVRPCVLTFAQKGTPIFLSAHADWTQSAASEPFAAEAATALGPAAMGGMWYLKKTDGRRNDVYERFVWTVSSDFASVLPTVPNPASPWKKVTGTGVWCAHGASRSREADANYWRSVKRLGLDHMIVTDHETMWRDGNESFTFRTEPAPGKGGDEVQRKYTRVMTDELGFVYGPYNNFTDFAPVNAHWNRDWVARKGDGQPVHGWYRCYGPKPIRAVEACAKLSPENQRKFGFTTAYCDVHTATTPWTRCDYDARLPGAGTFAQTFYCYGEIMLLQREAWKGPVYSEGGCHWMYCGLTDGNYAQDYGYRFADNPWIVDFDLLRLHPLCCNFGMGMPSMFYDESAYPKDRWELVDLFLAATAAFGHPGFFVRERGLGIHSYAMIQAVASRYTQATAERIRYADGESRLMDTSSAIASEAHRLNRVAVRYSDGTVVAANGGKPGSGEFLFKTPSGRLALPPASFAALAGDGRAVSVSGLADGHRADLAVSEDYLYMNGRGTLTRTVVGKTDGLLFRRLVSETEEKVACRDGATLVELPYAAERIEAFDRQGRSQGLAAFAVTNGVTTFRPKAYVWYYEVRRPKTKTAFEQKEVLAPFAVSDEYAAARTTPDRTIPLPYLRRAGMMLKGGVPEPLEADTGAAVSEQMALVGGVRQASFCMHPPYRGRAAGKAGASFLSFSVCLPADAPCVLSADVGKRDGSVAGDGIFYRVEVLPEGATAREVAGERHVTDWTWEPIRADLTRWQGRRVTIYLIADSGPTGNTSGDWCCWADVKLAVVQSERDKVRHE